MTTAELTSEDYIEMPPEPEPTPAGWDGPKEPEPPELLDHDDILHNYVATPVERMAAKLGDMMGRHEVRSFVRDRVDERVRDASREHEPEEPATAPAPTSTSETASPATEPPAASPDTSGRYHSQAEKDAKAAGRVYEQNNPKDADEPAARRSPIIDKDAETVTTPQADPEPAAAAPEQKTDPAEATTEHTPVAPAADGEAVTTVVQPEGPRSLGALPYNFETPPKPSYEEAQARGPQERYVHGTAEMLMNVKNPNELTVQAAQKLVNEAYVNALVAERDIVRESDADDARADQLQTASQDATNALHSALLAVNHLRARTGLLGEGLVSEQTFRVMNAEITAKAETEMPLPATDPSTPDVPSAKADPAEAPARPKSVAEKEAQELIDYYKADKPSDEDLQQFNQIIGRSTEQTIAAIKDMIERGATDDATVAAVKEQLAALKMLHQHGEELYGRGDNKDTAWQEYEKTLLDSATERPADPAPAAESGPEPEPEPEPTFDAETGKPYGSANNMVDDAVRLSMLKAGIDPEALAEGRVRGQLQEAYQRVVAGINERAAEFYKQHGLDPSQPLGEKLAKEFELTVLPADIPPVPANKPERRIWSAEYGNGGAVSSIRESMIAAHRDPEQIQATIEDLKGEQPPDARAV